MCIIVVHMGECPPSDKGVGCEHGTWGHPCSISAIFVKRKRPSVDSSHSTGLVVVIKEEPCVPRSRAERFLTTFTVTAMFSIHAYQPHSRHNSSGTYDVAF